MWKERREKLLREDFSKSLFGIIARTEKLFRSSKPGGKTV